MFKLKALIRTARMHRLMDGLSIAGRTCHIVRNLMSRLKYQVSMTRKTP